MDSSTPTGPASGSRSPAEIERDLEATRERLATNIDQLAERVKPAAVAKRSTDKAKARAADGVAKATVIGLDTAAKARALAEQYVEKAKVIGAESSTKARAELVDVNGKPRADRLAAVGAAAAAVVSLVIWRRRR